MPWKDHYRWACKRCGRERQPDERLSARGLCPNCGKGNMHRNADQLHEHAGPYFDHWRRRCLAAFGVHLPEEP